MARRPSLPPLPSPRHDKRRRRLAAVLLAVAGWLAIPLARGAATQDLTSLSLEELMEVELPPLSATTRFQVSATAVDSCVVTATDLAFGNYDPLQGAPTDATSEVTVTCTVDSGYTVSLDSGVGPGATVAMRKLAGEGGSTLSYSLYRDAGRALVWGNTAGTDTAAGVGTGLPVNHTVYGRIPPGQAVRRGTYLDTITVSVNY